jgi:Leucine-rich repeat (LRR) protein
MRIAFALFVAVVLIGCEAEAPPDEVVDVVADPQPKEKPTTVKKNNVEEPVVDEPKPGDEEVKPEKQPKPLKGLPQLKSLQLRATSVTDAGIVHLKELKNLQEVILNGTLVTDAGVNDLQTALPNCTIRR